VGGDVSEDYGPGNPDGGMPPGAAVLELNIPAVIEVMRIAVRRAYAFMALGIDAAGSPAVRGYQLTALTGIQLLPEGLSDPCVDELKGQFRLWVEAAGLRELAEGFLIFLDRVHEAALLMQEVSRTRTLAGLVERQAAFHRLAMPAKLERLASEFGIASASAARLQSINKARNCLAHRSGTVEDQDRNDGDQLTVRWLAFDTVLREPSGTTHRLRSGKLDEPLGPLVEGALVEVHAVERSRSFRVGERLALTTQDLAEICLFYWGEADRMQGALVALAERQGIPVRRTRTATADGESAPPLV
jgi:hypothetical protein